MSTSNRMWFYDGEEVVYMDLKSKTIFMPYDREPETYGPQVKFLLDQDCVVQLEIV